MSRNGLVYPRLKLYQTASMNEGNLHPPQQTASLISASKSPCSFRNQNDEPQPSFSGKSHRLGLTLPTWRTDIDPKAPSDPPWSTRGRLYRSAFFNA